MSRSRCCALLNLIGLAFTFFGSIGVIESLTQRTTEFRLVQTKDGGMALCDKEKKVDSGYGGPLIVSQEACPDITTTGRLPEIVADHPAVLNAGIALIIVGFILQIPFAVIALK